MRVRYSSKPFRNFLFTRRVLGCVGFSFCKVSYIQFTLLSSFPIRFQSLSFSRISFKVFSKGDDQIVRYYNRLLRALSLKTLQ